MRALYIGRFQPFHKGHAEVTRLISKEFEELIIGIGSSKPKSVIFQSLSKGKSDEFAFMLTLKENGDNDLLFDYTPENPFTAQERNRMIKAFLKTEKIDNYKIYDIPDINLFSAMDSETIVMPFYIDKTDNSDTNKKSVEIISSGEIDFPQGIKFYSSIPFKKAKKKINSDISKGSLKVRPSIFTSAILSEEDYSIVSAIPKEILLNWVEYVISILPKFDVVFSNNSLTAELFSEKGYKVRITPLFSREQYSGTEIRRRMAQNESWEDLVPEAVVRIIKDIHGVQRVQHLFT